MSFAAPKTPVSQIIHNVDNHDEPKKKTREDWRKAKELEEARKAGTAPAAVDEEGKDINPHIPQYISSAPWYYGASGPTLKHQRPQKDEEESTVLQSKQIIKGVDNSRLVTKFRKGACDNCGAITHKKKDCLERPRKKQAKYAESIVVHDEHIVDSNAKDYDEKRDRWSAYDPASHKDIVDEFEKVEEAKRQLKADKLKDNPEAELSDEASDEDKYVDEVDMPGTKVDSKQRITVRNLRIREDTAKYLRNLDPNSAYYDPKTRSMRDNPNPQLKPDEVEFAGENTVRYSGDTTKHSTAQLFAWEAHRKGVDVHLLAEPTKLELLQKDYNLKKEEFKSQTKDHILEKYGGEEHLQVPPKSLLLAQNENYIEYSRSGKVVKGMEKSRAVSAYEEDVFPNNHKTIWGSFWHSGRWGYKCCKSFIKNSYCVSANKDANEGIDASLAQPQTQYREDREEEPVAAAVEEEGVREEQVEEEDDDDDESEVEDSPKKSSKKSKKSKKKKKKNKRKRKDSEKKDKEEEKVELDDRKRPYNSMYDVKAPTEEELEQYMIKRTREEDPMLQFMGN